MQKYVSLPTPLVNYLQMGTPLQGQSFKPASRPLLAKQIPPKSHDFWMKNISKYAKGIIVILSHLPSSPSSHDSRTSDHLVSNLVATMAPSFAQSYDRFPHWQIVPKGKLLSSFQRSQELFPIAGRGVNQSAEWIYVCYRHALIASHIANKLAQRFASLLPNGFELRIRPVAMGEARAILFPQRPDKRVAALLSNSAIGIAAAVIKALSAVRHGVRPSS
jgi:hypothetical protein